MRTLRSPFDGVVVEKLQSAGEMATTNINQPILKLARIHPLHVEVSGLSGAARARSSR